MRQHFVPKFYFRRFTRGENLINLLLTANGRVLRQRSVRDQCAERNFYGSEVIERELEKMESKFASAIRALCKAAARIDWSLVTDEHLIAIQTGLVLQRGRTRLQVEKGKDVANDLLMPSFRQYVESQCDAQDRDGVLNAIDTGQVKIVQNEHVHLALSMSVALECAPLITDLEWCVLRNWTQYPFIFGDSPVVLYNTLMRNVLDRGVLGLQTPGLQIFYPLDEGMLLLLYDPDAYNIPSSSGVLDVTDPSDISQLNALQLHHSKSAVYFADRQAEEYVLQLWRGYRHKLRAPALETRKLVGAHIDGEAVEGELLQTREPQLNITLRLSFVSCDPICDADYTFRHRSPVLVAELRSKDEKRRHQYSKGP